MQSKKIIEARRKELETLGYVLQGAPDAWEYHLPSIGSTIYGSAIMADSKSEWDSLVKSLVAEIGRIKESPLSEGEHTQLDAAKGKETLPLSKEGQQELEALKGNETAQAKQVREYIEGLNVIKLPTEITDTKIGGILADFLSQFENISEMALNELSELENS